MNRAGYSLMEAIVALFVLAVAATGLLLATQAHIDSVFGLQDRIVAQGVAETHLAELVLDGQADANPSSMGIDWTVRVVRQPTQDEAIQAVEINVSRSGDTRVAARLSGFVDIGAAR